MESGWFMLIVLAVMGGLIAYLGDKIVYIHLGYYHDGYQHCRCYLGCHVRLIGKCQSSSFRYE